VAAGYGLTPYGIGDWGSENTIIPDTGSVTTQHGWGIGAWNGDYGWGEATLNTAPIVQTGIVPSGGTVLIGSAPVVIVVERVKTPGTGVLGFVGGLPQLRVDFFATPAANDAVITGHAPSIANLFLVGSAPVLKNPNWVNIDDSQTANWVAVAA
jgi:hypothetical protein